MSWISELSLHGKAAVWPLPFFHNCDQCLRSTIIYSKSELLLERLGLPHVAYVPVFVWVVSAS